MNQPTLPLSVVHPGSAFSVPLLCKEKKYNIKITLGQKQRVGHTCSTDLCHGRVLAEVKVAAEVAVVADDLRQDIRLARVTELGVLRELAHIHQPQQVSLQLVHLVHDVCIQRQHLKGRIHFSITQRTAPTEKHCFIHRSFTWAQAINTYSLYLKNISSLLFQIYLSPLKHEFATLELS